MPEVFPQLNTVIEYLYEEKERRADIRYVKTLIPIEKIQAPVLMLSSKHDEVWPSFESATYMEKKLTDIRFPYPHKHVAYENMSHAVVTRLPLIYKYAFKSERQHPKACAKDREE